MRKSGTVKFFNHSRGFGFITPGEMFGHYFKSNLIRLLVVLVATVLSAVFWAIGLPFWLLVAIFAGLVELALNFINSRNAPTRAIDELLVIG